MKFEEHCNECIIKLGQPFPEVQLWLDELFSKLGVKHRRERHHLAGVEEVRKKWGDKAAEAALLHIKADLRMEGWREEDGVPRDRDQYIAMGLF